MTELEMRVVETALAWDGRGHGRSLIDLARAINDLKIARATGPSWDDVLNRLTGRSRHALEREIRNRGLTVDLFVALDHEAIKDFRSTGPIIRQTWAKALRDLGYDSAWIRAELAG